MKTAYFLTLAVALALARALVAQQTEPLGTEPTLESVLEPWTIDLTTYEIIPPHGFVSLALHLNSPQQLEQRKLAFMALLDPESYFIFEPKSVERLRAEDEATATILHPKSEAEIKATESAGQAAARDKAVSAILHPTLVADSLGPALSGTNETLVRSQSGQP